MVARRALERVDKNTPYLNSEKKELATVQNGDEHVMNAGVTSFWSQCAERS